MSTGRLYSACLLACLDIAEQLSDFETFDSFVVLA